MLPGNSHHSINQPDAIVELEASMLEPRVRNDRHALEHLLHPEFVEFGASGRIWSREITIHRLTKEHFAEATRMSECRVFELGEGVALLTYQSVEPASGRVARRSSLWLWHDRAWQLRFHQGTPISPEAASV